MLQRLLQLLGVTAQPGPPETDYDPVYGLSRQAIDEWLARNPQIKKEQAHLRRLSPTTAALLAERAEVG